LLVPEYWIVSRRGDHVLVSAGPVARKRRYEIRSRRSSWRDDHAGGFPDVTLAVDDLLPPTRASVT
jgi:hypothetical protein